MKPLSARAKHLRNRLETVAVRLWLARPGRVMSGFVVLLLVTGFSSLGLAFHLMMNYGVLGSILGALWLMSGLVGFMVFGEPWLAPTGLTFRSEHAWKAQEAGAADYLARLDGWARQAVVPCRVNILAGQCPWLLAYGVERCLAPVSQASRQAASLDLATRAAPLSSTSRRL